MENHHLSWENDGKSLFLMGQLCRITISNGKTHCLMGKLTISMAIFNSYMTNCQRVWDALGPSRNCASKRVEHWFIEKLPFYFWQRVASKADLNKAAICCSEFQTRQLIKTYRISELQKITGWWFQPLWKILVNWDDEIPNIWENKSHVPNHQPVLMFTGN